MTKRLILKDNKETIPLEGKDIHIIQDTQILQQILKTLPGDVKNQINVVMINEIKNQDNDFEFLKLLQSLPEPRLENLKKLAIKTVLLFFKEKKASADFLGIERRRLAPSYREQTVEHLLNENEDKDENCR